MPSRSRILKIVRNVLLMVAALVAAFFLVVVPWFFTSIITHRQYHYPDPNDGKTPKSYNLDFRWIEFTSPDGIPLKGWYIPAEGTARGTIIYCHGLNRTRIEMLPDAVFGHSLGYNGLLFDFRHQGMSGGAITTLGYQERLDVEGAVRYALEQEQAARPVVVWGVSMGASAALMAAAESPDISAVISDSSFDSMLGTMRHHLKLFLHLPGFPIADEVGYWVGVARPLPRRGFRSGESRRAHRRPAHPFRGGRGRPPHAAVDRPDPLRPRPESAEENHRPARTPPRRGV